MIDGAALLIGVVIGVGVFKTPQLVALNVGGEAMFIGAWVLGGLIMLVGALCYAELGSAHPDAGGEYHFLSRAYGQPVGVLFAWARGTVIQTGAIAAVAFVFGEYASVLLPLGPYSIAIHAALGVLALTGLNLLGKQPTTRTQVLLVGLVIVSLIAISIAGFASGAAPGRSAPTSPSTGALGLAMVFVLLTYGGWNETAYLSGEMRDVQRNMIRTLLLGTAVVSAIYVLANLAYLTVFGLQGLRQTGVVGAELMQVVVGDWAAILLSGIVCMAALSTLNATIFTGARSYYALGRDVPAIRSLGVWDGRREDPTNALILQCVIALALVAFGAFARDGFEAMVAYTAPVFWFFLLLIAISIFVLRQREPDRPLPYRMPLYPLPPILFGIACTWMIYSALMYAGIGSVLGVVVLVLGLPLVLLSRTPSANAQRSRDS